MLAFGEDCATLSAEDQMNVSSNSLSYAKWLNKYFHWL
jgi:hypothetical protein